MNAEQARIEENNSREQRWHLWGPYLSERRGERCARITARTAMPGIIFRTSTRVRVLIAGTRMASPEFAITSSGSVSPWPSGTVRTRILKERLFGLTGPQGNHGEDVKELYWYTDNTPIPLLHADVVSLSADPLSLRGVS